MKKILLVVSAALMAGSIFVACGGGAPTPEGATEPYAKAAPKSDFNTHTKDANVATSEDKTGDAEPKPEGISVAAYLIYDEGGESDFNIISDNVVLWNTIIGEGDAKEPSHNVSIVVSGEAKDLHVKIIKGGEVVVDKTMSISGDKKFIVRETGCEVIEISITNANIKYNNKINFDCGD
jgi:hypothetical protein